MGFAPDCNIKDLDEWIDNDLNVLFEGKHGVGKTARIIEVFSRKLGNQVDIRDDAGNIIEKVYRPGVLGEDFLYYSCSTLDPWVDLVGVPKETTETINGKSVTYLKLVRPKAIELAQVKAIFLDEYNRAPKKVRNAVMELLQFKSINGHKFPNLRVVWAAINPDSDESLEFDVEKLDPAQRDRFDVQVEIAYEPDLNYFTEKFGREAATAAVNWWKQLTPDIRLEVSPRRLEKAVMANLRDLDLRFMLPKSSNPNKLHQSLKNGIPEERFRKFIETENRDEARKWLAKSNNLEAIQKIIINEEAARKFALPLIDTERLSNLMTRQVKVKEEIFSNPHSYRDLILELAAGSQNEKIKSDCQKLADIIKHSNNPAPVDKLELGITELPAFITKKELASLEINYEFSNHYCPTLADAKNDKGEPSYAPFVGDFSAEVRRLAYFCNLSATNTYYRQQLLDALPGIVLRPDLVKEEVVACFRFLEFYASRSNSNSVYRSPLFSLIFNSLVKQYRSLEPSSTSADLYKIIPNVYYRYFGSKTVIDEHASKVLDSLAVKAKSADKQIDPVVDEEGIKGEFADIDI